MFNRRIIFRLSSFFLVYILLVAHSPWGQYLAYRQEHLLIMSTREDLPTYPFSKILVDVINEVLPEAKARPARARTFKRVQSLFSSGQMPLVLLSKKNAKALINGNGPFKKYGSADAQVLYIFDDLVLLVQPDFPNRYSWLLTKAIMKAGEKLPGAISPLKDKNITKIHPGVLMALNEEKIPELKVDE